ncbi:hypothetical protein KIN20_034101 [Parelaphostrongylus tenuis]|uniref:Uncharacterized protein n=1 Tax=Parelaphostrongylus tenuis TaxID=148309 RepID=A0AAD5R8Z7_PARTN|nr:hypothetical protein KIN20_034101 [Parelaphostrongylus tenuis]
MVVRPNKELNNWTFTTSEPGSAKKFKEDSKDILYKLDELTAAEESGAVLSLGTFGHLVAL